MNGPTKLTRSICLRLGIYVAVVATIAGIDEPARACNVPVFRYALERWRPDPYRLTLFHRGPLPESAQRLAEDWADPVDPITANAKMRTVDLAESLSDADQKLFDAQSNPQLPLLVVQYPVSTAIEATIWSGPMGQESLDRLVVSPLRTELVRRLSAGQTAVWLLLESGDATKDDAAAAKLDSEIKLLAEKLKLPELTTAPEDNLLSSTPLKIGFSVVRVPRGVAAEQSLVEMLLHSESDLYDFKEPMIFPVFGRGRALLPLIGAGITPENLRGSADFLVGECSCEIKELNPGFDLLLSADWPSLLFNAETALQEATLAVASGKIELVSIPVGAAQPAAQTASRSAKSEPKAESSASAGHDSSSSVSFAAVGGLMLVAIAWMFRRQS